VDADALREGARILTICNACRYCEGYCAVFPALERRASFCAADLNYLANLCHHCGECYYACPYAPPHEFSVNVPKTLSQIRVASYRQYAWPAALGAWLAPITFLVGVAVWIGIERNHGGSSATADFYAIIQHRMMAGVFGAVSILIAVIFLAEFYRFWRESGEGFSELVRLGAVGRAAKDVLSLRYLDGEGYGCTYPDKSRSRLRWWFHQLTFYGFVLCFVSTTVAAGYHYVLLRRAPYPYLSWPVVLGTLGGAGLLAGPAGLLWLKRRHDAATRFDEQNRLDIAFILLLLLTSGSGLALLGFRDTAGMPALLAAHLAIVLALFATLPYGKFVHAIYRAGALLRNALERSREGRGV
jgi:citrate/tricarballylate utilization protein